MDTEVIFWDEDTQIDFMYPDRPLYVPGAETILPNLARLTECARSGGVRVTGSEDWHSLADAEISSTPDWKTTFPPHCMAGTEGQRHVPETAPRRPLHVESRPEDPTRLIERVRRHPGEVYFRKQTVDVFSNPNVEPVLDALAPRAIVLYGVATDICVFHALEGFLRRGGASVVLVEDAVRALNAARAEDLLRDWRERGVEVASTETVVSRYGDRRAGAA